MALKGTAENVGRYPTLCHCRARHGNPIASGRAFRGSASRLHCSTMFRNGFAAPTILNAQAIQKNLVNEGSLLLLF